MIKVDERYLIKYLRLSLEDDNINESGSISNQRSLLDDFILKDESLQGMKCLEMADDGYTGSNANRPGLKQIEELLRKNMVGCIIVKDFSRFTRDYIFLGNYLEQILPFLEVRFIAVNDNYDSLYQKTVDMDVQFKSLLNNMYSADISAKVRSGKRQLIKMGKKCSGTCPYGYIKDVTGKYIYSIDEPAADIVRKIFSLTLTGWQNIEIARYLNNNEIPTPYVYKRMSSGKWPKDKDFASFCWNSEKIMLILRNELYKGTLILGRFMSAGIGSGKTIEVPEEEWFRKENAFPAIVSCEDFDKVQLLKPYRKRGKYNAHYMLYGKVKCGCCQRYMYHKPSDSGAEYHSFFCKQPRLRKCDCFAGYIKEKSIMESLTSLLNHQMEVYGTAKASRKRNRQSQRKQLSMLQKKLSLMKGQKIDDYEEYRKQKISKELYLERKERRESEEQGFSMQVQELQLAGTASSAENYFDDICDGDLMELNREVIDRLVDTIWVYDSERIKIKLRYSEEIM